MKPRRVTVVGYDAAELLDMASVTSTLMMANLLGGGPLYRVRLATPGGRPITCGSGLTVLGEKALERVTGPLDTLIVSGGIGHEAAAGTPVIVGHVRRLARESRRIASVCTGATILAAAGLLDGRRATTHWVWADGLAARYPRVTVDPAPIFIRDGDVVTSAGVTSALDLTLALIEEDHGAELARQVSRNLVTYMQRPGNQAQMSMFTAAPAPENHLVNRVTDYVHGNLAADLTTPALATEAGLSERHLTRLFRRHIGQTPGRYVRLARIEAAAHLLTSGPMTVAAVAARCGFGTAEALRQAFVGRYGIPPSRYRTAQGSALPATRTALASGRGKCT